MFLYINIFLYKNSQLILQIKLFKYILDETIFYYIIIYYIY